MVDEMNNAGAWCVRGVGLETRKFAEDAARRVGLSLGDWLDEVVAERAAADQGVSLADGDAEENLEAPDDRLSRVSHRDSVLAELRREVDETRQPPRPERKRLAEEARRTPERFEATTDDRDDEDKLGAIGDRRARPRCADRGAGTAWPNVARATPASSNERAPSPEEFRRAEELLETALAKFESRASKIEERTAKALEFVAIWIERNQADRARDHATLRSVAQKLAAIEQRGLRESRPAEINRAEFRRRARR